MIRLHSNKSQDSLIKNLSELVRRKFQIMVISKYAKLTGWQDVVKQTYGYAVHKNLSW